MHYEFLAVRWNNYPLVVSGKCETLLLYLSLLLFAAVGQAFI